MKKILYIFMAVFMLAGCGKKEASEVNSQIPDAEPQISEEEKRENEEIKNFFDTYINTDVRPFAVMVDNDDNNARPQAGLEDAYILYELIVEGGSTRFMGIFRNANTEKIGPVRSSRHYFLDYVLENNAIYVHFGWSPKAMQDIPALGINKINGVLGEDGDIFWREQKYQGDWHSAYTSVEKIKNKADKKGYSSETDKKNGIKYSDKYISLPEENKAETITLSYSGGYRTSYLYNKETGLYEKSINGAMHKMQSGEILSFKNVIVELVYDSALGDGSPRREINTVGTGKAYYFTGGAYEEITRTKQSRGGVTVYKRANGEELYINPGKTMINIISPSAGVKIN